MSVSLEDGAIYARSEAKVVGVNDQAAHRVSLAGMEKWAMQWEVKPRIRRGAGGVCSAAPEVQFAPAAAADVLPVVSDWSGRESVLPNAERFGPSGSESSLN